MSKPCEIPPDLWAKAAAVLIDREPDQGRRLDLRIIFEHRAAVCEYDGGLSRQEAERIAFAELRSAVEGVSA